MDAETLTNAATVMAELRGDSRQPTSKAAPRVEQVIELAAAPAAALVESKRIAGELAKDLGGFVARTKRFVGREGGDVIDGASSAVAALVRDLDGVYDGAAAPPATSSGVPQAHTTPGGAALLAKALHDSLGRLADPAIPQPLTASITKARDALASLLDLVPSLEALDDGAIPIGRVTKADADPLCELPTTRGPRPAVLQLHVVGKALHADLRIQRSPEQLVGWTLDLAREGQTFDVAGDEDLARIAKAWAPEGSRRFAPMLAPSTVGARAKALHPVAWLELKKALAGPGEVGASSEEHGAIVVVEDAAAEFGLQSADRHEYFLSKSANVAGVLVVEKDAAGQWNAQLRRSALVPEVLTRAAVLAKRMPPDGHSGLPASLEALVPAGLRFWTHKGDEARALRDELVESGRFADDTIAVVDGELRLLEKRLFVADPPTDDRAPVAKADGPRVPAIVEKLASSFPAGIGERVKLVTRAPDAARLAKQLEKASGEESLVVYDLEPGASLAPVVEHVQKSAAHFVIGCDDTAAARVELAKLGQPFAFPLTLQGRTFVASFPVSPAIGGVEWIAKSAPAPTPKAPANTGPAITVSRVIRKADAANEDADEERFVYGIVLEPDVVDKQQDTYTEETIRTAAHKFLEEYGGTIGLQHREFANGRVKLLESFVAPADIKIGDTEIKKGTWLMGCRVVDDTLWSDVKAGKFTGFSIGGSAIRTPVDDTTATSAAA
jgi:hypothetical protein